MNKYQFATFFALIAIGINCYIIWKARQPGGVPRKQHGRLRVLSGICLVIAILVFIFGQFLGLE